MKLIPLKIVLLFTIIVTGTLLSFGIVEIVERIRNADRSAVVDGPQSRGKDSPVDLNEDPYVLDLSGQNLTELPEFVWERPNITHLILSNNQLQSLPDTLGTLSKIRVLKIDNNQLEGALTSEIRNMELEELDASHNRLSSIPAVIAQMPKLKYLNVADNQIADYPNEMLSMDWLEWVNFKGNPIPQTRIGQLQAAQIFLLIDY